MTASNTATALQSWDLKQDDAAVLDAWRYGNDEGAGFAPDDADRLGPFLRTTDDSVDIHWDGTAQTAVLVANSGGPWAVRVFIDDSL